MCLALLPDRAAGFKIRSLISDGCHEAITLDALQIAGWPDGASAPPLNESEQRVLNGLPIGLSMADKNAWALATLIGVRSNDLAQERALDLLAIAAVHADPAQQAAHCLRAPEHDGESGDRGAVASCHHFIIDQLRHAIGTDETIDLTQTTDVRLHLGYVGRVTVSVSRYGYHLGRALHALQDSYSHTLRSSERGAIRHVLNFVDWIENGDAEVNVDGHPHLDVLDLCQRANPAQAGRRQRALLASVELIAAIAAAGETTESRLGRANAVLERRLAYESGCTSANQFCGAPELDERVGCVCRTPASTHPPVAAIALVGALWLMLWRRKRHRRPYPGRSGLAAAIVAGGLLHGPPAAAHPPAAKPAAAAGASGLALSASFGAAYDEGALAVAGGVHWRFNHRFSAGIGAEYNPWFSPDAIRADNGTFNLFASGALSWLRVAKLALRTSAHAGVSVLLFDLVGADRGATGPYLGLNLLGVSYRLSDWIDLFIDPGDLRVALPNLQGVPIIYRQYRFTVGFEVRLWTTRAQR